MQLSRIDWDRIVHEVDSKLHGPLVGDLVRVFSSQAGVERAVQKSYIFDVDHHIDYNCC